MNMISALLKAQPIGGNWQANTNKNVIPGDYCCGWESQGRLQGRQCWTWELKKTVDIHWNWTWGLCGENRHVQSHTHLKELTSGNDERVTVAKGEFVCWGKRAMREKGGCWERNFEEVDAWEGSGIPNKGIGVLSKMDASKLAFTCFAF